MMLRSATPRLAQLAEEQVLTLEKSTMEFVKMAHN